MIKYNPQFKSDGTQNGALTSAPSDSIIFDVPGKCIWVKGVKLATSHTYTFSHDNYITLTNTPGEPEDILIGVNTTALKNAIDTTYGIVNASTNGLAPMFSSTNKATASAATTYNFLGIAGSTLKWYQLPWRNIRINSETSDKLGVNDTDPLIISQGDGISVTWDSTGKKIVITNSAPDQDHNTDYTTINKGTAGSTTAVTQVKALSSAGVIFEGGTNKFKVGDGTNYFEIPITPSFTIDNKAATIRQSLTTIATINGTDITAKIDPYIKYYNNLDLNIDTLTDEAYILTNALNGSGWDNKGTKPTNSHDGVGILNVHTHKGNYYTLLGLDTKLNRLWIRSANNAASFGTWLVLAYTSEIPTVNNASLTLQTADTTLTVFYANDSTNRTFNVTCANIGAATSGHNHNGIYVPILSTLSGAGTADNATDLWGVRSCYDTNNGGLMALLNLNYNSANIIQLRFIVDGVKNLTHVYARGWHEQNGWQASKEFAFMSDLPTKASWNYDDVYSKLGHTHPLSIAADSGTSSIALAASTKYKLTAGGSTYVFTSTPDEKVRQVPKTDNTNRPLMMINGGTSQGEQVNTSMFSTGIYANASTNTIFANAAVLSTNLTIKSTSDVSSLVYGGGGFHNKYANIVLKGDTSSGVSGIVFTSSKGDTSINVPSDCAFIQFHPYGHSALAAIGSNPTLNTSGESNKLVIGVNNDSDDMVYLQTPALTGLKHVVGTNVYTIWDSGNDGSGSGLDADLLDGTHKADLLTAASLGTSGNNTTLSVTVGGTTKTGSVTVPYATNADTLDGYHASYFHIQTARSYNSVNALPGGTEGWYNIFTLNDNPLGAAICVILAYAHSSITFIVSKGYSTTATCQVLQYNYSSNGSYFYVKGVRVVDGGKVLALFNKASNIYVNINIFSTTGTLRPNENLTLETGSPTVIAGPCLGTHNKITSDIVGNITGNAGSATKLATARNLKVNLASASAQSFDGTADVTSIGVAGTLPFGNLPTMYWANQTVSTTSSTTTSPTFTHVYLNGYLYMSDSGGTMRSTIDRSGNSPIFGYGQGQAGYHVYYTGRTVSINAGTSWSSTANGIYINASNNIGIGTNSPATKLDVRGTVTVYPNANLSSNASYTYPGGAYYSTGAPNFRLYGDNNYGLSTIEFLSSKGGTSINVPSDCAFIQFQPYGFSSLAGIGSYPGLNSSGEANKLIIGVNNDADDMVCIQTPSINGLRHIVGTSNYQIWNSGNTYVSGGTGVIGGTTITQVANADTVDGKHASDFRVYRWASTIQGSTWSRLYVGNQSTLHHSSIFSIEGSIGCVVFSGTYMVESNHSTHACICQLIDGNYTLAQMRVLVNSSGDVLVDMYWVGNDCSHSSSTLQMTVYVSAIGFIGSISPCTSFTNDNSVPSGYSNQMTIQSESRTLIHYRLRATENMYATHFYESSDIRLKHDISMLSKSIRKFKFNNDDRPYYGFIAQELETLHPELVDSSGEYKTVNYSSAICYYIAELENKVQKLEDEINKLKNK